MDLAPDQWSWTATTAGCEPLNAAHPVASEPAAIAAALSAVKVHGWARSRDGA